MFAVISMNCFCFVGVKKTKKQRWIGSKNIRFQLRIEISPHYYSCIRYLIPVPALADYMSARQFFAQECSKSAESKAGAKILVAAGGVPLLVDLMSSVAPDIEAEELKESWFTVLRLLTK